MKISQNQKLALSAALLPSPENREAWNALVASTPVLELDGSITRIMPAIYQSLHSNGRDESVGGHQKLKGSYLFAWAKNTEFIANIKALLLLLEKSDIDYRILKGGALNFLLKSLGSRSMGDIDFLVGKKDLLKFQKILEVAGYRKKFADACSHIRSGNSDPELNYVNSTNIEIDLHVMEDRRPKLLFSLMLETPPIICEFMDIRIRIPPAELLIMHSIYHGNIGVQSSDEIQSLMDVRRLIDFARPEKLSEYSRKLHFEPLLESYLQELISITREPSILEISQGSNYWQRLRYSLDLIGELMARFREYPAIRKARGISNRNLRFVFKNFRGHRFAYCIWLYASKLRQVERLSILLFRGFLAPPKNGPNLVAFSTCSSESQDWRFATRFSRGTSRAMIEMRSESFSSQSFLVFANGRVAGVTDRNSEGVHHLELLNPPARMEISLRLPMNGCEACAQKLKDLSIHFS